MLHRQGFSGSYRDLKSDLQKKEDQRNAGDRWKQTRDKVGLEWEYGEINRIFQRRDTGNLRISRDLHSFWCCLVQDPTVSKR